MPAKYYTKETAAGFFLVFLFFFVGVIVVSNRYEWKTRRSTLLIHDGQAHKAGAIFFF